MTLRAVAGSSSSGGGVSSVNGQTGAVVLDAADVQALPAAGGRLTGPIGLMMTTVATAPDPTSFVGNLIYVSDAAGGAVVAFSDGTSWISVITAAPI